MRSLPTKCYGVFSLLLFKSTSVLHKEFFQYLIEDQWCPSSDDFRKMYWVGSFYLLIINIESYQGWLVLVSGSQLVVYAQTCPMLTSSWGQFEVIPGMVWRSSGQDSLSCWPCHATHLCAVHCCEWVEWKKLQERCMNLVHEISLICLGKLSVDCMWNKSVCLGRGTFSVC